MTRDDHTFGCGEASAERPEHRGADRAIEGKRDVDMYQQSQRSRESEVRSYCRAWPTTFVKSRGSWLFAENGAKYLDFFAGAGALNYGHNPPVCTHAVIEFLSRDGVAHALDMNTDVKLRFLEAFERIVLAPRALDFRVQFPGPSGASAVEAALKLACKATGRSRFVHLRGSFHGMSLGAMSVSDIPLDPDLKVGEITSMRFPRTEADLDACRVALQGGGRGAAAALVIEVVQGEGGIHAMPPQILTAIHQMCRDSGTILIVDDIQMGVGRTGPFFTFETSGIQPDIVCMSKSISGMGLPMALTLISPVLDIWSPGEHSGTFRAHSLALVAATAALEEYWQTSELTDSTTLRGARLMSKLDQRLHPVADVRGRGLAIAVDLHDGPTAAAAAQHCFENGLLVETCGTGAAVLKLLPPLTSSDEELDMGTEIILDAVDAAVAQGGDECRKAVRTS